MPAIITLIIWAIWVIFWKTVDVLKDISKWLLDFFKDYGRQIVKWWFFLLIINLLLSIAWFTLYHLYYWSIYIVSQYVNIYTLNIIHISTLWLLLYFIYNFMYKD